MLAFSTGKLTNLETMKIKINQNALAATVKGKFEVYRGGSDDSYIFFRLYAEVTITPIVPPAWVS